MLRTIVAAIVLTTGTSAWATIIQMPASSTTTDYNSIISATDLINIGQASLASASSSTLSSGTTVAGTQDGVGQTIDVIDSHVAFFSGAQTFQYNLNTDPATGGSATGYTLTQVDCFAGWKGAPPFALQSWNMNVQTLDNPGVWSLVVPVNYTPFPSDVYVGDGYTHVRLTDTTGLIAEGVTAVQFFFNPYTVVVHEIDVVGTATVPEPGTLALLTTGLIGLLAYAWRKRT